jgi:taurine--2-oxoglutarate transaminase
MGRHHAELAERHPSVGAVRNLGLFGLIELIRDRTTLEPMAPFNGSSDEMKAFERSVLDAGVYTMVRWWYAMTNPPLCIDEEQLAEGFAAIDQALSATDRSVTG